MDKRKKIPAKDKVRADRFQLYHDIEAGKLTLQEAVKKMRAVSGLTQPEFAEHRGVSLKVLREIERGIGNPTVNTLNQIAKIFALEVSFRRMSSEESLG